jgi:hypothetical protein
MAPVEVLNIFNSRVERCPHGGDLFALNDPRRPGCLRCPGTALATARRLIEEDADRRTLARNLENRRQLLARLAQQGG